MYNNTIENDTLARYQEISSDLISKIRGNEFPEGSLLPSENFLINVYNTSRTTIRRALDVLDRDGYIMKKQGKGSIVLPLKHKKFSHIPVTGVLGGLEDSDFGTKEYNRIFLSNTLVPAPINVANRFNIAEGAPILCYDRIYTINGLPYIYSKSYINNHFFKGIEKFDFNKFSLSSAIFSYGLHLVIVNRKFSATNAGEVANHLNVCESNPILHERYECLASTHKNDVIVEIASSYYNTNLRSVPVFIK